MSAFILLFILAETPKKHTELTIASSKHRERKWILEKDGSKRLLWQRSWEDRYTAPGEPMTRRGARGKYFIVQPTPTSIYLQGAGASPVGDRPFLDRLDFGSEEVEKTRLWRCTAPVDGELDATKEVGGVIPTERKDIYESMICLLPDNETIMIGRESKTTKRNYFLTKVSDGSNSEVQVTHFEHPQQKNLFCTWLGSKRSGSKVWIHEGLWHQE